MIQKYEQGVRKMARDGYDSGSGVPIYGHGIG